MKIFKIRPSQEVLETSSGTRRRTFTVDGEPYTLDFGREATYLELDKLPVELEVDPHLVVHEVTEEQVAAAGGTVLRLKPERVQDPVVGSGEVGEVEAAPEPEATSVMPPAPVPPAGPPEPRGRRKSVRG